MAFTLAAIVGSTTVTLSDSNPFRLVRATGMGGASVRRVTAQGPAQQGDTDLGYRLQPRTIELVVGFHATTDALLDAHRSTLTGIFKPLSSTPVKLRVTRDDGEVRQIDCYTVGTLDITLVPEHRPGHYHEATVRLRAADPAWYGVTPGTVTVQGTAGFTGDWWLAGGAIDAPQVLMHGTSPAQGEAWSYMGTIGTATGFTLVFRSGYEAPPSVNGAIRKYAFSMTNTGTVFGPTFNTLGVFGWGEVTQYIGTAFMTAGTQNYFLHYAPTEPPQSRYVYQNHGAGLRVAPYAPHETTHRMDGTVRTWRGYANGGTENYWTAEIPRYALYSPNLSESQVNALAAAMTPSEGGTISYALAVPYAGDLPEYPVVHITGPLSDIVIENTITGDTLDFGTVSIGAGTTYVIDTRYGRKTILAGTINKRGDLTADSDLAEWHIVPDPVATGGVNVVAIRGTGAGTATQIDIVYYDRFSGF